MNSNLLLFVSFLNGLVSLVVEVVGSRVIAPYYASTIYVWTALISVTLGFLSFGYLLGSKIFKNLEINHLQMNLLISAIMTILPFSLRNQILNFSDKFSLSSAPLVASSLLFSLAFVSMGVTTSFLTRLLFLDKKSTEKLIGVVYALGTLGSLVGALISSYLLIPHLSLTAIFLLAAMLLVLTGLLLNYRFFPGYVALVFVILTGQVLTQNKTKDPRIIYSYTNFDAKYEIINISTNSFGIYCLLIDSNQQGCFDKENKIVSYQKFIYYAAKSLDNPKMLILGAGLGTYTDYWSDNDVSYDLVDINPKTLEMIKVVNGRWNDEKNSFINQEARLYLRKVETKYDIIYNDLLTNISPVAHVYSHEFNTVVKSKLNTGGIFITHIIGKSDGSDDLVNSVGHTLRKTFNKVYFLSLTPEMHPSYVIFLATDNLNIVSKINKEISSSIYHETDDPSFKLFVSKGHTITDDFNKIEHLWSKNINENYSVSYLRQIYKFITSND